LGFDQLRCSTDFGNETGRFALELGAQPFGTDRVDRQPEANLAGNCLDESFCGSFLLWFQTDGTAWTWGSGGIPDYPPNPSPFKGTNWTSFYDTGAFRLAVREDGTLWAWSQTKAPYAWSHETFGEYVPNTDEPAQVGHGTEWNWITQFPLSALKKNGEWWVVDGSFLARPRGPMKVSRYSDWLAISSVNLSEIGIAADGTISCWTRLNPYPYYTGQSRGPTWSTNVFKTSQVSE
jgi:hypothetical protein